MPGFPRTIRFKTLVAAGPAIIAGLLLSGCMATKGDVRALQEDNSEFRARLAQMDSRLGRMEVDLDTLSVQMSSTLDQALRTIRANQGAASGDMDRRMSTLSTRLEDNERRLTGLMSELEKLNRSLQRFAPEDEQIGASAEERRLFDQSQSEYLRGNYELARIGYRDFYEQFQQSELRDDALYWIAETYMAENSPDSALAIFRDVERQFPDSERMPAVLLKQGILLENAGRRQDARRLYRRVVDHYSEAAEAEQARIRLE